MKVSQIKALEIGYHDEFEASDSSAMQPGCHRLIRFVRWDKKPGLFLAHWKTRHAPETEYKEEWCINGMFDCRDLTLVGTVKKNTQPVNRRDRKPI